MSPIGVASAAASTTANYNQFQVKLTADSVTNTVPSGFGTSGSAGRIWTDKSVTAESDGSFGVTLSALAQEYMTTTTTDTSIGTDGSSSPPAADVTFILDMSTSMGTSGYDIAKPAGQSGNYYRVEAMALAANEAIRTVMNANPKNRVAVHWFGGSASSTHVGTLLEMGSYTLTSGSDYLVYTKSGSTFTIATSANLKKDGNTYSQVSKSLASGTPTQNGIRYGLSKTIADMNALGTRGSEPQRMPYVFVLSDGAASIGQSTWSTLPSTPTNPSSYNNQSGLSGNTSTGSADVAAVTILTGMYMKDLLKTAYSNYNGTATDPKFYTVGLGSEDAIYGTGSAKVYAWAGLDPQNVYANQSSTTYLNGTAKDTYDKIAGSTYGGAGYVNSFVYSNYYTWASNYDLLSGAFGGLAADVEAASSTTSILPLLNIPETGELGSNSETADMTSAIVFVDEIGEGFAVDLSTLRIGSSVATVDNGMSIEDGTAYQFAGYGSKAVIKTVGGVTSLVWYIDAEDMQSHIYRFTDRSNPVAGQYSAPADGSFTLNYNVKPAFTVSPVNVVDTAYYLNSGNDISGAKTAAYFTPPEDSPYYDEFSGTQTTPKSDGIESTAEYVTEESMSSDDKVTMKLGNNGRLDLEMGIVKSGPATVAVNGTITYTVTIYNYTDEDITGLSVTSEGQTQTEVDVPAKSGTEMGSTELIFSTTAPSLEGSVTSGTAVVSGLASNTVTTAVTDIPNELPTVADFTKNGTEDTDVSFAATDFSSKFDDADSADELVKVKVTSLPANGTLKLNGSTVTANQEIAAAALGTLTFTPNTSWNGTTTFGWNGTDGKSYANTAATVTIVIAAANAKPTVADFTKNGTEDTDVLFAATDFSSKFDDSDSADVLVKVKVTSLPEDGALKLDGAAVMANQEIAAIDLDKLTFTPDANWNGQTTFGWNGTDGKSYADADATVTIDIAAVNDKPTVADIAKNGTEDIAVAFATTDFSSKFTDVDGNLTKVKITSLPEHGTLKLDDVDVAANQEIAAADLDKLTFVPDANWSGQATFGWNGSDGTSYADAAATVTIDIAAVNDKPTVADFTVNGTEDNVVTFEKSDFNDKFTDVEGDSMTKVKITSLPGHGTLKLNGGAVAAGQEIDVDDLGTLTFTPDTDWNGTTTFGWNGTDGENYADTAATVTIDIEAVNDKPTVADIAKNGTEDTAVTFAATDFSSKFTDIDGNLTKVKITSLPENGTLKLDGIDVTPNQEIAAADLDKLTFVPDANWSGQATFDWNGSDGASYADTDATVTIDIEAVNDKPTVADITVSGAEDDVVTFEKSDFSSKFTDIEGDSMTKVKVTSLPGHGILKLNGEVVTVGQEIVADDLGTLTFTPDANWNGQTTFGWNGSDGTNYADTAATVTIDIEAVNDKPTVADIAKNGTEDTAVTFAATDFSSKFTDIDTNDALVKVKVTSLPEHGTLKLNAEAVTIGQEIPAADLIKLTFVPNANWNGQTTFGWNGSDGTSYADEAAMVTIDIEAVNDKPTVADIAKTSDGTDVLFAEADFSGKFADVEDQPLTQVKVTSLPEHGTLKLNGVPVTAGQEIPVADLGNLTFTPNAGWNGTTSFGWNGSDGEEYAEVDAQVNITVQQLEGWVGSRGYEVTSPLWVSAPGNPMKLSATTPDSIDKVTATFDFAGGSTPVELKKVGSPSNGVQLWESTTYLLPYTLTAGVYHATFIAYTETAPNEWTPELTEPASKLANNGFKVIKTITVSGNIYDYEQGPGAPIAGAKVTLYDPTGTVKVAETSTDANGNYSFPNVDTKQYLIVVEKQGYGTQKRVVTTLPADPDATVITQDFALVEYDLQLTASPSSIIGDGNSRSLLKAVLRNGSGVELANVPIVFSAGVGTFEKLPGDTSSAQANTVMTNEFGEAYIYYKSEPIEGVISQQIPVTATADDSQRSLYAQEQIIVTFEPTSVNGVIKQDGVAQAGVTVRVVKDFDGDGVIDFAAEAVTDENGNYSIAVPKGNVDYTLQVSKTVVIDGVPAQVTFEQKATVGNITGIGVNYDSNQTVSGVIALKPSAGGSYVIDNNSAIRNSIKVYLKNTTTGVYVGGNATPTAFTLDNGVFNAEIPAGDYELEVRFVVPNAADPDNRALDKEIIINALDDVGTLPIVTVTATGELNIVSELIDPYGTVTDKSSGSPIEGATVTLYYANTPRNIAAVGKTPGTPVTLPKLVGFAPNDNDSPEQLTDINGLYAYMVYPETDYYVVVAKAGYNTYVSPTLEVNWDIVKHDIEMVPYVPSAAVVSPDVAIAISTGQNVVKEGTQSTFVVDYKNESTGTVNSGTITVQLPEGVEVIDAAGGTVNGNTITWDVTNLAGGQAGSYTIKVEWPQLNEAEKEFVIAGEFSVTGSSAADAKANSTAKVKVSSDRFGNLSHQRYIIGMPDGEFKLGNTLTRAELAAIVARLTVNETIDYDLPFSDVRSGHWATNYIRIAVKYGYFSGFADGTFRPDQAITRGELAAVMARFLELNPGKPVSYHFSDTEGNWAGNAIEALYLGNYLTGYSDGTFRANQNIRRDEAVTLINRMLFRGPLEGLAPVFPDVPTTHWAFGEVQEATVSHESIRNSDGSETFVKRIEDDVQ
ncbi:tandem-95 repeat protein [Cohnella fermenti]|uniref:tandem-95 repeat protein n=1 Tax=Cohnella fermenti TaxID=2565925 RepID=UPI001454E10B|nr:tandem-95 repeat protein [Cohnella fermenti]